MPKGECGLELGGGGSVEYIRERHDELVMNFGWCVVCKVKFVTGQLAQTFHEVSRCLWWLLSLGEHIHSQTDSHCSF